MSSSPHEILAEHFSLLPDGDERLHFLIQLGRGLPPLDEAERCEENLVRGCVSSVWLVCERNAEPGSGLRFRGGSEARIVAGLVSIVLSRYSGLVPGAILALDPSEVLVGFGLESELSPGRRNGLSSMVARIRRFAAEALG